MVLNYKLTRSFSSDVRLNGISSDQVVLLQSVAVLFFASSDDEGTGYFIIGGRNGFARAYASVNFTFLVSRRSISLGTLATLWT